MVKLSRMRLPVRMPEYRLYQKWLAAAVIALVCAGFGVVMWAPVPILRAVGMLDNVFYDSMYRFRPIESQVDGPIVIIAVNDKSIDAMQGKDVGWPWPRDYWGQMITYLDAEAHAKAVVFDLLFDGSSVRNRPGDNDDQKFASAVNAAGIPVILAGRVNPDGTMTAIVPPIEDKIEGAANISDEGVNRFYSPIVNGRDSIALKVLKQTHQATPDWAARDTPFLLHYYGPHSREGVPVTFKYVEAASFLEATNDENVAKKVGLSPELFKDKIVFIAAITAGTYDLKTSPVSSKYPGVEIHATALQNMLDNERVVPVAVAARVFTLLGACFLASLGTVIPARVPIKLVGGVTGVALVLIVSAMLFLGQHIRWMPPASATMAAILSAFVGLSYSYLTELRQRRFILKAFAQSVSKEVADEIAKDPRKLGLGGQRREMTVMFTDLANFTAMTESIQDEKLTAVLQFYLEEMSGVVLGVNGTVDKYIGDAIMAFWNAPANQPDHAIRACRAALDMRRREAIIQPRLREMSGVEVYSRIGINSGPMFVGNLGSTFKFSYTVIGDSVNLGSRLEGANKLYGTRIMLSETTAAIVGEHFILRKLDLLRVKGKQKPIAVFELIRECTPGEERSELFTRYEEALNLYQTRRFEQAQELLTALKRDFPEDGPTDTLLDRVLELRENPPGPEWDGVYVAKEK
jgi:adenylate cyclase